ncbi:MAG: CHASE2 domain-containing protein [Pseudomonadota bacterium]
MQHGRWWSWPIAAALLAVAILLLCIIALRPPQVIAIQSIGFDAYQGSGTPPQTPSPVAVVLIREQSLTEIGPWPWPRRRTAALIEQVAEAGASRIVLPIVFDAEARDGEAQDARLMAAIERVPTVIGTLVVNGYAPSRPADAPMARLALEGMAEIGSADFGGLITAAPDLRAASVGEGAVNLVPEADMVVRRVPTAFFVDAQAHPSLALAALMGPDTETAALASFARMTGVRIGDRLVPTDGLGRIWIEFSDRAAIPVLEASMLDTAAASVLDGRIVVIGVDAAGVTPSWRLADGGLASGPEILASAIDALARGTTLVRPEYMPELEFGVMAAISLGLVVVWLGLSPPSAIVLTMAACVGWISLVLALRIGSGLVIDAALPVSVWAVLGATAAATRAVAHWRSRGDLISSLRDTADALAKSNDELEAEASARRRAEQWLEQASHLAGLGYALCDVRSGRCEICSEEHASAYGLTPDVYIERLGTRALQAPLVIPEDRGWVLAKQRELVNGKTTQCEYRVVGPDGHRRLREVAKPLTGPSGMVEKILITTLDVTELRVNQEKLAHAQKMESVGRLTSGIAHDFNNLLAVVLGNLELVKADPGSSQAERCIDEAIAASFRGRDLSQKLLSFGRRAYLQPQATDVNQVLHGFLPMLARTLPAKIAIETRLNPGLPTVMADRNSLESAMLNLAINARDAMMDGGRLTISTEAVHFESLSLDDPASALPPGVYVCIAFRDSGHGIPPEHLDRVREPFFSTKAPGAGSGLGLSMVDGFMNQSGGALRLESVLGEGTTARLLFPATERPAVVDGAAERRAPLATLPPGRVLVVEDDAAVRAVTVATLQNRGLTLSSAEDADRALEVVADEGPIDVLLADIVLPGGRSGIDLARELRERDPALGVILISGDPVEALPADREFVRLIKPVPAEALVRTVHDVLMARSLSS